VQSVESQPTFRKNISPVSLGWNKSIKIAVKGGGKQICCFRADIILGVFDPKNKSNIFLRNIG
jgi:hypothetical protein